MRVYPGLVVLVLILTVSASWFYHQHFEITDQSIVKNLNTIARLRADEVHLWRKNLLKMASFIESREYLVSSVNGWLASGSAQPAPELAGDLEALKADMGYDEVQVLGVDGQVRWSSDPLHAATIPEVVALVQSAMADGEARLSNFLPAAVAGRPRMALVVPLPGADRPPGALLLTHTPGEELYTLLSRWPTASAGTAETYLCQITGDSFQYLSPPTLPGHPMALSIVPASQAGVAAIDAVRAVASQPEDLDETLYRGVDYRGVNVVTVAAPVPGTPWVVVAEVDERDAYADWYVERNLMVLLYVTLLFIPLLVGVLFSQMKKREYYERLSMAAAETNRVNRLYDMLLQTNMLIVSARKEEVLLAGVARIAVEQGGFLFAWYGQIDGEGNLVPVARAGEDDGYIDAVNASVNPDDPRSQGPAGRACRTGELVVHNDFLEAPDTALWQSNARHSGVRSSGHFPVFFRGRVVGCLSLYAREKGFFGTEESNTLREMASDVSFALDNLASENERNVAIAEVERLSARMNFYMRVSPIINYALHWDGVRMMPEWVSENVEPLLGYSKEEVMDPEWWVRNVHPEDVEAALGATAELKDSNHVHHRYRFLTKSRAVLWVLDTMEAIRGTDGELVAVVGAWADVSSQVASEQALRTSEARYRDLFENNPYAMYMHDPETLAFIAVNEAAVQRYGYSREEFLQMSILDIRPPDEGPRLQSALQNTSSGFVNMGIWRHRLRGGEEILVEISRNTLVYDNRPAVLVLAQDVTARVRAEKALHDSEERLRLALSSSGQGTIHINFQSGEVQTSPEYAALLGFDPETFQETDAAWSERIHPEDRDATTRAFNDCISGQSDRFQAQYRQQTADGRWVWISTLGKVVERGADGVALRFAGTIADVSEAKRTEELLRLQSASLAAAANGIVITDMDGHIVWANPAFVKLTGYTLEEAQGHNPRELVRSGKTDPDIYKDMWDTIVSGKTWQGEWVNRCKDGRLYTEKVAITPVLNPAGVPTHFVAIKQDITELKRNQEALQASQARYKRILETVGLPLAVSGEDGSIRFVNERFTRVFGYTQEDIPTIAEWWESAYPDLDYREEARREWEAKATRALESGGEIPVTEKRVACKNGESRFVEISGILIGDEMVVTFNDLTARVMAEEELRKSEAYLREGEILARTGAFHLHRDHRVATFTPGILGILGIHSADQIAFDDIIDRVLPPYRASVLEALERCAINDEPQRLQFQIRTTDGDEPWVEGRFTHATAAYAEYRVTGVIQDITERKKAEEEIREMSEAVEQAADGIVISDLAGRIRYVNRAWAALHGYDRDSLIGQSVGKFYTPEELDAVVLPALDTLQSSGSFRAEVEHLRADGSVFPGFMTGTRLCNEAGEPIGMIGVVRDVTESKRAAAALRAGRERLNYLIEVSPAIIYTMRTGKPVTATFVSNKVREVFGYAPDDFLGAPDFWIDHVHPEDREEAQHFIDRIHDEDRVSSEYRFRHADGRYVWVHDELFATRDPDGNRVELIGAWMDVTERKRISEMEVATIAAEAANHAKSSFLATMSHEIRTPMNGVIGTVDLLRQTRLASGQAELVEIIRESAHSLLAIINDILDFSKIEAGKLELDLQPLAIADMVENLCGAMSPVASAKGVRLACFVDPKIPPCVTSDPVRVRQILNNLISNAIKFSAGACAAPSVRVRAEWNPDNRLALIVTDNGVGMCAETIHTLFKPFTQADSSISRRFGGTGLGLSICRSLCDMLEGSIEVVSAPGEGATFTVILPVRPVAVNEAPRSLPELTGLRCIIASGDPVRVDDWTRYLASDGVTVVATVDPASAWQISPDQCDVVLAGSEVGRSLDSPIGGGITNEGERAPLVIVTSDGRRCIREEGPGVFVIYGDILRRETLLRAMALATGRITAGAEEEQALLPDRIEPPSAEEAAARGRLILVAEDNEINQKVIRFQLAMLDVACDMAANGEEALDLWRRGRYAMLLTDLHMPVMDGYALAAAVRAAEGEYDHIPIIAFTANVSRGEPDRCRAAGMDGYLTKPVPLDDFKAVLDQWLPEGSARPDGTGESPQHAPLPEAVALADAAILDLSALEALVGNDPAIIKEFLADYLGSVSKAAVEIEAAFADADLDRLGALAHRLKSSSRSVGALSLGDCCERMEHAGKAGNMDDATAAIPEFRRLLSETVHAIVGEGISK